MCLIAWNWQPDSDTPLLLLANRDEFYARATLPLHWWHGDTVLAGRDLQGGGTWLGISRSGRLAALTNHRVPAPPRTDTPSRGELVANFLQGDADAAQYLQQLAARAGDYNPFNLLVFDGRQLLGLESRTASVVTMQAGVGAVSNADFQTPWPKLALLKQRLQAQENPQVNDTARLLALLQDRSVAPDALLPHTGVPIALERALSATFVVTPQYGTRACSVVRIHQTHAEFTEQRHNASGVIATMHENFRPRWQHPVRRP